MPPPRASRRPVRARQRRMRSARRARRVVGLAFLTSVLLVTLLLTAFGTSPSGRAVARPVSVVRPLAPGPPRPQVIALQGSLPLQLPVPQDRLTAVGYHAASGALPLEPLGRRANEGALTRIVRKVFGGGGGARLRYFQLSGGEGPETAVLDVGAPAGTDVYSPVDGVIVGIDDFVLNGRRHGHRIELQPAGAPSVVVSLTRLRRDPSLRVGSSVSGSTSKLGTLLDLSRVEEQALARYTNDAGNHVSIEVHPAATLTLP